jgi:hypothetical protein
MMTLALRDRKRNLGGGSGLWRHDCLSSERRIEFRGQVDEVCRGS